MFPSVLGFPRFELMQSKLPEPIFILELDDAAIMLITVSYNAQKKN